MVTEQGWRAADRQTDRQTDLDLDLDLVYLH